MKNIKSLLYLMILIVIIPSIIAQNSYFGISLDCLESCKDGTVDISKPIMLKLEIKNNFDYWVSLGTSKEHGSADLRITAENSNLEGGRDAEMYNGVLGGPFFLKPKTTYILYLPFEIYNKLDQDKRLSEWKVTPEFLPGEIKYFKSPYDGEQITNIKSEYKIPSTVKGNILKFEPKKEEVEVEPDTDFITKGKKIIKNFFKDWTGYMIAGIIVLVVAGIILYRIKKK